ncbi:ABC transporter permease [Eubacterium sp.]|uniref:ABC transporter permease n=1 Tax=Eubacterium sp. TaxID=142586 RepID=UPI003521619F
MKFGAVSKNSTVDEEDRITDAMIEELKQQYSNEIDDISLTESVGSATVKSGSDYANINLSGVNTGYFTANDISLVAGRNIKKEDVEGNKKVIMVSDKVVDNMFDGDTDSALGSKINVSVNGTYYYYYIVGVYRYESDGTISTDTDEDVTTPAYIPITVAKEQTRSDEGYTRLVVVTSDKVSDVSEFADRINAFLSTYYVANEDYEISTTTMTSLTESMNDMINTVSIAVSFIAGISLLVGGIGVMNIMLVSITERTREIGTRKALGAKNSSIRLQFIIKSVILCLIGGILGIVVGFILGVIAAVALGYSAAVPVTAVIVATIFSMVIGIFFGYYPANKAAKLNPIEALRYE